MNEREYCFWCKKLFPPKDLLDTSTHVCGRCWTLLDKELHSQSRAEYTCSDDFCNEPAIFRYEGGLAELFGPLYCCAEHTRAMLNHLIKTNKTYTGEWFLVNDGRNWR